MDTIEDLFGRFEQLNEIGAALSHERDLNRLLETILVAAKTITHADGGTLYRVTEDERSLRFEIVRTDSLKIAMGGTSGNPIPFPLLPLRTESGEENNSMVAAYAAIHQKTVNIADAYIAEGFDFSGTRKFDERTGYRSQSFLTVPMKNHENEIDAVNFHSFMEASAISAAITLSTFEPGKAVHINLATHMTPVCDCLGFTSMPILPDAGVFGSDDIVAVDQAVLHMTAKTRLIEQNLPTSLEVHTREGHPFRWLHGPLKDPYKVTEYGEQLGLGSRDYELVDVLPVEMIERASLGYIPAK